MLSDFQFDLPPELIAQTPAAERDQARLLVIDRAGGLTHTDVRALPEQLRPGDLLVVNDTRVIPARLFGRTAADGGIELLLIRPLKVAPRDHNGSQGEVSWLCLGKPARRLRLGAELRFPENVRATVADAQGEGRYRVTFHDGANVGALMDRYGEVPLPPYIRRPDGPLPLDQTRYQTIFASQAGAIAAPTAGLHFTENLFAVLRGRGIDIATLTLHVGPGTFLPVRCADPQRHVMDPEWCNIPEDTAARMRRVKAAGGRVVAVGTTTTRALESAAACDGTVLPGTRWADRFIVPGYPFRVVDALFTNFHLPGSPLLLLVSAFAGRQRILDAYVTAIRHRYRFYSYGDAMLIQ